MLDFLSEPPSKSEMAHLLVWSAEIPELFGGWNPRSIVRVIKSVPYDRMWWISFTHNVLLAQPEMPLPVLQKLDAEILQHKWHIHWWFEYSLRSGFCLYPQKKPLAANREEVGIALRLWDKQDLPYDHLMEHLCRGTSTVLSYTHGLG